MSAEENENPASDLAALGYPGFSYLKLWRKTSPAEVLFSALSVKNLDTRLTEALPWVLLEYPDLAWIALRPGSSTFRGLLNLALHSFKFQPVNGAAFAHDHS